MILETDVIRNIKLWNREEYHFLKDATFGS